MRADEDDDFKRNDDEDTLLAIQASRDEKLEKPNALPQMSILYIGLIVQVSNLSWVVNNLSSKHLLEVRKVPNIELNLILNIGLVIVCTLAQWNKGLSLFRDVPAQSLPSIVCGAIGYIFYLVSATYLYEILPLSVMDAIYGIIPMSTALLVWLYVGERITASTIVALTLILAALGFMTYFSEDTDSNDGFDYWHGIMFGVVASVAYSTTQVVVRKNQQVHWIMILNLYNLFSIPIFCALIAYSSMKNGTRPYSTTEFHRGDVWLWVVLCASNVSALVIESFANQKSNPTYISLFYQIVVVYDASFDYILFDTVPSVVEGVVIVFVSVVTVVWLLHSMRKEAIEAKQGSEKLE